MMVREAAELADALLPVHLFKEHPLSFLKAYTSL